MREPEALEARAGEAPGGRGTERRLVALALILTVAPLAVSALHTTLSHGSGYHPTGDMALTELLTRDVGTGNSPLIGPFSRDGWHHPGPTAFYVFALPYRLLGSTSTAMNVAALVVNGLSVAPWRGWHVGVEGPPSCSSRSSAAPSSCARSAPTSSAFPGTPS
jgi:hypothetical protein